MLRTLVLVAALLFLTAAIVGVVIDPMTWPSLVAAGLLVLGTAFERVRYGAARRAPVGGEWRETPERFVDDMTGRPVSVWFDPATGERRYVEIDPPDRPIAPAKHSQ